MAKHCPRDPRKVEPASEFELSSLRQFNKLPRIAFGQTVVTDGLRLFRGDERVGHADREEVGGRLNIGRRIWITHLDDEKGRCSGFEA